MANTKRRIIDRSGNMFLPMNMEGNNYTDSFWSTPKLIIGGGMMFALLAILLSPVVGEYPITAMLKLLFVWAIVMFFVLRYIIFEERFNYKMYKQMQEYEIQTPATFWDIIQIKNTTDGAILTYRDGKIAVLLKVDRDTITGKPRDFKETHFDAISDFYNRLQNYKFSFVQMNVMEPAGNDPRLAELDKLVTKSDNPNIQKLIQLEVGYTKSITRKTLYESDIFLIYVKDRTRVDTIINDVEDCVLELLNGAYIGYRLMTEEEVLDFIKDQYGVSYFNRTQATLQLFSRMNSTLKPTFEVVKVEDNSTREYEVQKRQFNIIHNMAVAYEKGKFDINNLNIKRDVISKDPKYADLVKFSDLQIGLDDIENKEPSPGNTRVQSTGANDRLNKQSGSKVVLDDEQHFKLKKDIPVKSKPKGKRDEILGRNMNEHQDGRFVHGANQGIQQNIVKDKSKANLGKASNADGVKQPKTKQPSLENDLNSNKQFRHPQEYEIVETVDDDAVEVNSNSSLNFDEDWGDDGLLALDGNAEQESSGFDDGFDSGWTDDEELDLN